MMVHAVHSETSSDVVQDLIASQAVRFVVIEIIFQFRNKVVNRISRFNKDQRGLETLQVVLIIAVAAIILALIVNQWPNIKSWAENAISAITGFSG